MESTQKQSYIEALINEQSVQTKRSKTSTRLEFARAKNRKERAYANMMKTKERARKAMEKFREDEAASEAACEDCDRLKKLLSEEATEEEVMDDLR